MRSDVLYHTTPHSDPFNCLGAEHVSHAIIIPAQPRFTTLMWKTKKQRDDVELGGLVELVAVLTNKEKDEIIVLPVLISTCMQGWLEGFGN